MAPWTAKYENGEFSSTNDLTIREIRKNSHDLTEVTTELENRFSFISADFNEDCIKSLFRRSVKCVAI